MPKKRASSSRSGLRLGLCCTFSGAEIRFRTSTVRYAKTLDRKGRRAHLRELVEHNARTLDAAIAWCAEHDVRAFRVHSGLVPLATHPDVGYGFDDPEAKAAVPLFRAAGARAADAGIRLSFHPDQFVVPGSVNPATVESSLAELEHQAELAELVGAEQLTIHGGGAQGGKAASLARLRAGLERLSPRARAKVVLENDDRVYTVEDLLPLCRALGMPLVYDVHHHRCHPDTLSIEQATDLAAATWGAREPWAHLSSPAAGWKGKDPRPHADHIAVADVPASWLERRMTIDVEAKDKEHAVLRLQRALDRRS